MIKKYGEFVNELFDPVKVRFNILVEENDEFKVEFEHDGETYFFQARDENKMYPESIRFGWHLGFGRGQGDDKYSLTGKGTPFKIFSIIKQALDLFINKYNPQKMSFIAEGDAKANIYLSFFKSYTIEKEETDLDSFSGKPPYLFKIF
ncbi:MAG: hypothetical protein SLAVMIC_00765 [uncultured marine phage]|uniref:Uncharacterized protein n=1 Tax=uncultured marine phage TaxID=707152 RepID=A0A8D9FSE6_9VIRU|nr:MAG: hypothetical protein SLAVMIC_00765 [uncultured marine phage]